jgi:hypothetical protein
MARRSFFFILSLSILDDGFIASQASLTVVFTAENVPAFSAIFL